MFFNQIDTKSKKYLNNPKNNPQIHENSGFPRVPCGPVDPCGLSETFDTQIWMPIGGVFQFIGYALAGRAMDRFGRKPTQIAYLGMASLASIACYQAESKALVVASYFGMVAMGGMWSIAQTISAELFPTRLRATANGLTHNLIGRMGMFLGPSAVGALAMSLDSTGDAVALLGLVNFLAIPLLIWLLPETRAARLTVDDA